MSQTEEAKDGTSSSVIRPDAVFNNPDVDLPKGETFVTDYEAPGVEGQDTAPAVAEVIEAPADDATLEAEAEAKDEAPAKDEAVDTKPAKA